MIATSPARRASDLSFLDTKAPRYRSLGDDHEHQPPTAPASPPYVPVPAFADDDAIPPGMRMRADRQPPADIARALPALMAAACNDPHGESAWRCRQDVAAAMASGLINPARVAASSIEHGATAAQEARAEAAVQKINMTLPPHPPPSASPMLPPGSRTVGQPPGRPAALTNLVLGSVSAPGILVGALVAACAFGLVLVALIIRCRPRPYHVVGSKRPPGSRLRASMRPSEQPLTEDIADMSDMESDAFAEDVAHSAGGAHK
jgi:hypothetical protein